MNAVCGRLALAKREATFSSFLSFGVALAIAARAHPREIQELCRDTSFTTTMNVYGGLLESLHERLAERLGAAFRDGSQTHAGPLRDPSSPKVVPLSGT